MRPLAPTDDAAAVEVAHRSQPSSSASGSSSAGSSVTGRSSDLVPMQYAGLPQQHAAGSNGSSHAAGGSAGQTVGVSISSNGGVSAGVAPRQGQGAVLYREKASARSVVQSAAASAAAAPTFQRSMMVAGFEEGEQQQV